MEPVAGGGGGTGEWTEHNVSQQKPFHSNISDNTKTEKKAVAITNLFHVAAEVHTCHSVPVTLEMSLKGWIRLYGQRDKEE